MFARPLRIFLLFSWLLGGGAAAFSAPLEREPAWSPIPPAPHAAFSDSADDAHWSAEFGGEGQLNWWVFALAEYEGRLIAGGLFNWAGAQRLNMIAAWTGERWEPLGSGFEGNPHCPEIYCPLFIEALLPHRGDLIAGGSFIKAGGRSARFIARWDGAEWHALGSGMDSLVVTLAEYGGDLIAGGLFTRAGGVPARGIARWDGTAWHPLGLGVDGYVHELEVYDGRLIAGGRFGVAGTQPASRIAAWDGSEWHPLGEGSSGTPFDMVVFEGALLSDGRFWDPSASRWFDLGRWDGSKWVQFGPAENYRTSALAVYRGKLVRGFNGPSRKNIERWNGAEWRPLGSGTNAHVQALQPMGTSLYLGGRFTLAGGKPSLYVARWDDFLTPVVVEALHVERSPQGARVDWWLPSPEEIAGILVERSGDELGPYGVRTVSPLAPERRMSFLDSAVLPQTDYWYRLRIRDRSGGEHVAGPVPALWAGGGFDTALLAPSSVQAGGPTVIRYRIGRPSLEIQLDVYSVSGRLVRNLARGPRTPGEYMLGWDGFDQSGRRIPPGVYLVRLRADRSVARKLIALPDRDP